MGVDVGSIDDDGTVSANSLPVDAPAIADGLGAWAAQGVDHVQLGLAKGTEETFAVTLDAVRRFHATDAGR